MVYRRHSELGPLRVIGAIRPGRLIMHVSKNSHKAFENNTKKTAMSQLQGIYMLYRLNQTPHRFAMRNAVE